MNSNKNGVLTFAVGGPKEYRSALWRIWVRKNSVYLTTRDLGGIIKLSLHPKVWRLAYTEESGIKVPGSTDRVEKRWAPSPQFKKGWVYGPSLIIPATNIEKVFNHPSQSNLSKVTWINPPRVGYKYQFTILFAELEVPEDDLSKLLGQSDICLARFYLMDNTRIFLCQKEIELTEMEKSRLAYHKNNIVEYNSIMPEEMVASIIESDITNSGHPYLVDIPLGWENIRAKSSLK